MPDHTLHHPLDARVLLLSTVTFHDHTFIPSYTKKCTKPRYLGPQYAHPG